MSNDYDEQATTAEQWAQMRRKIEDLINRTIREQHGDAVFTTEPIWKGSASTHQVPPPDEVMRLAIMAQAGARRILIDAARAMRGKGTPWQDIFPHLGIEDETGFSAAEKAFQFVAGPGSPDYPFDPIYVYWKCSTCGEPVTDKGPYNGHPADNERGHAEGCARHAAEIAAYLKQLGDD